MIPNTFNYIKANSVDEALTALNGDAKILAGGHSLIPTLKLRLNSVETLIDISKIPNLQGIKDNEKSITIGAATTHADIAANSALAEHAPMMVHAAGAIGDIQVRNKGTIGGSMAHADPAADWPAALLAADANVNIQGPAGSRVVDIDQFFKGFYETALEDHEIISSISIPKTAFNKNSAYLKFKQPASRFAIVGCAVAAEMDGDKVASLRVGLTGVGECAFRAMAVENELKGKTLSVENITNALNSGFLDDVDLMSDHYATAQYRAHLTQVYIKRALLSL